MILYELSPAAEKDVREVVAYTRQRWGRQQVETYIGHLTQCTEHLAAGETGFKHLDEVKPGLRVKHSQHHYIFGLMRDHRPMLVVAILHERMDLFQHLSKRLQ